MTARESFNDDETVPPECRATVARIQSALDGDASTIESTTLPRTVVTWMPPFEHIDSYVVLCFSFLIVLPSQPAAHAG